MDKLIIGAVEMCNLPELSVSNLEVRVDTGAKTSSLHADNIQRYVKSGKPWVKFDIHPDAYNVKKMVECTTRLHDIRSIKSSNGVAEERYVIKTKLQLAEQIWPIELTLTDRSDMKFMMLLGREGMADRVLVDPAENFLLTNEGLD